MSLIDLFESLTAPEKIEGTVFNALAIPGNKNFRIGIDSEGNPVLLLTVHESPGGKTAKNFRLRHLELSQHVHCKITENEEVTSHDFTVIKFINGDDSLQEYFFSVSETLVKFLSTNPSPEKVMQVLNQLVEIFRSFADSPTKTVQGLWGELFLIDVSNNPSTLINYWHAVPEEKFDFNSYDEKIEVKSSSSMERIHSFSSEQLNPLESKDALIASVFVRQSNRGTSIQGLLDSISQKVNDLELLMKLDDLVGRTLGSTIEQSLQLRFDLQIAKDSLRFYRCSDIHKIEPINIPDNVFDVRYKSDLSNVNPTQLESISTKGTLFAAL